LPVSDEKLKAQALAIDKAFLDAKRTGGSTGTFFYVYKEGGTMKMQVGNVGDSRVLVSKGGVCHAMTTDHKPNDQGERRRIESCNGTVENNRVNGSLAVSRAFGDGDYKRNGDDQLQQQVIALPEVTHTDMVANAIGDFALLACDGVFEGNFSNEEVVAFVNDAMTKGETDLSKISYRVCVEAIARGSKDNISCMIVQFVDGTGFGAETHTEFVPGPFNAPSSSNFRRAYFDFARKAGVSDADALARRWAQIEARAANEESAKDFEGADQAETNFFKDGPGAGASAEAKTAFFARLTETREAEEGAGAGTLPGPLHRALTLQRQLGIPLHVLVEMMSNSDPDKDRDVE
jgi:protein phosphatase